MDGAAKRDFRRTLILGNSGSGKSWLAGQLGAILATRTVDLDAIHWNPGGYGSARDRDVARAMVRGAAADPAWVIEGVYGWLAEEATARATQLIWLDVPVGECLVNLHRRGLRGGADEAAFAALLAWAADYPQRAGSSAFAGHERLFAAFPRAKARPTSWRDVERILASARQP